MALSGWNPTKRIKLTIDSSKVEEDLTDFPVSVTLSSGTGQTGFDTTRVFDELDGGIDNTTKLMLHMDDTALSDSSSSSHSITKNGNAVRSAAQSKFDGYSVYFDGTGDYLSLVDSDDWDFGLGDFTIDWWMRRVTTFGSGKDMFNCNFPTNPNWLVYFYSSALYFFNDGANIYSVSYSEVLNVWEHYAVVRSGDNMYYFVDGVQIGSTGTGHVARSINGANFLKIGGGRGGAADSNCYMDEVRISKGIAKWTSNFTPPTSAYTDDRRKIAITDADDNQLYTEIERWDHSNEEANLWVKVTTIVSGTDTSLYLYYDATVSGNTTYIGDTGDAAAQNVWDSNFKAVYHMAQDPSGGSDAIKNSTSSVNHGTSAGSMTSSDLVDGKIGKAIDFDGGDDYINCGSDSSLDDITNITVETNFKAASWGESGYGRMIVKSNTGNTDGWQFAVATGGLLAVYLDYSTTNAAWYSPGGGISLDTWYHGAFQHTRDLGAKADGKIFIDGDSKALGGQDGIGSALSDVAENMLIASRKDLNREFEGILEEIRISNIHRSAAWLKATYYSNWNDFVTFGESLSFIFSSPIPVDLSTVYGIIQQLYLTTTVTGTESSYTYDATFYNTYDGSVISSTVSGTQSGQPAGVVMNTPSGINYQWYVTATSSGFEDTSNTYTFTNKFLCEGQVQVSATPASGIPVRLYRRDTGEYIGTDTSAGVSGTFQIETDYNEYHYAIALYNATTTNAVIADWLIPQE